VIEGAGFQGAVFDVDGVLVDSPHEHAWRVALDQLFETGWTSIRDATQYTSERFTPEVYCEHISGKPTMSGALATLSYFGVPPTDARTAEYARRKQRVMDELLRAGELTAYPDALRFVLAVRGAETPIAAASSSKNAARLLGQIRLDAFADREGLCYAFVRPGVTLLDIFDADVSGRDFAHGGKPHPEIFLGRRRRHRCLDVGRSGSPSALGGLRGAEEGASGLLQLTSGAARPKFLESPRPQNERAKSAGPR
jgi:beta-phosphoglucomutase